MQLSQKAQQAIQVYRQVLPPEESQALELWLTTFYPFQQEWLLDQALFALCNKSRQIGISHTTSGIADIWGAFHGELTTIISIGQPESNEVLEKSRRHAAVLQSLGSKMAKVVTSNKEEIVFASGGRILALPSSGGRSFSGNVFLDEYGYQEHWRKVWDAAAAVTMLPGHKLRISSSPNGVVGIGEGFHGLAKRAKRPGSNWSYHEIPIELAIRQGYPVDIRKCRTIAQDDDQLFAQLFNCRFLDYATNGVIGLDIVKGATNRQVDEVGAFAIGVDVARFGDDQSVIRPIRGLRALPPKRLKGFDTVQVAGHTLEMVRELRRYPADRPRVGVDVIGVGAGVADILRQHPQEVDLIEVNVSETASDQDKYCNLRSELWFWLKDWLLLGGIEDDEQLEGDLTAPRYDFDPRGRRRVEAKDQIKKRLGRSPDDAEALMLAVYASRRTPKYFSNSQPSRMGDGRGF